MIKKISFFIVFLLFFISNFSDLANVVMAKEDFNSYKKVVLVINQVRGDECCDPGSKIYLQQQVDSLKENGLKGNFAVRYDALNDKNFTDLLKNLEPSQFELGAFLEITPELTQDAGVKYGGEIKDWYKAQNAYTVGYSIKDRQKIIDTYMERFFSVFGFYPKFSTAWVMDTDTVNYMNEKYGLLAHQITREQWGTDSYTLSGGPVHYPYFASENWLFAKSENQDNFEEISNDLERNDILSSNKNKTIILRQTGADPLFNYGDSTNSFTTQPNDYAIGKRDINYFYQLKNQFANQEHNNYGFLLLGLENSMDQSYQDEFAKQLASIEVDKENLSLTVQEFSDFFGKNTQTVVGLEGKDFVGNSDKKSFWINGGTYRVRLIYKNNELYISDLRFSNDGLEDPYNEYVAQDLAFWVTPFIFNSSQHYNLDVSPSSLGKNNFKENFLTELRKKYLPEFQKTNFEVKPSHNDLSSSFDGIKIASNLKTIDGFYRNELDNLVLGFTNNYPPSDKTDTPKEITFFEDYFKTNFIVDDEQIILERSDFLKIDKSKNSFKIMFEGSQSSRENLGLSVECKDKNCKFESIQPTNEFFKKLREDYYPYFFPEIKDRVINNLKSVFYAHNQYAIADKNPARLIFIPRDEKGFAASYEDEPKIRVVPEVKKVILRTQQANGTTFIDLISDKVGAHQVEFLIGGLEASNNESIQKELKVYFAPDCKSNLAYCISHPVELIWYLKSMFYTKLRNF
jgi:hypothetical protein